MNNNQTKLTVLSFGGGHDSTAILLRLIFDNIFRQAYAPNDLLVVMADTGDEHPYTYAHVKEVEKLCKTHQIDFKFIEAGSIYHSPTALSLYHYLSRNDCIMSATMGVFKKNCSQRIKIDTIYRYMEDYLAGKYGFTVKKDKNGRPTGKNTFYEYAEQFGKIDILIGFSKGEESRAGSNFDKNQTLKWFPLVINRRYPLIEVGMDRADCIELCNKHFNYQVMPSNCLRCHFMSPVELIWLYRNYPKQFTEWETLENNKLVKNAPIQAAKTVYNTSHGLTKNDPDFKKDKNHGIYGARTLRQQLDWALEKFGHLTNEQITQIKLTHGSCAGRSSQEMKQFEKVEV